MVVDSIVIIGVISLLPFMFTIPSGIFCWEKQQAQPFFNELNFQVSQKCLMAFCNTIRLYVSMLYVSIIEKNNVI